MNHDAQKKKKKITQFSRPFRCSQQLITSLLCIMLLHWAKPKPVEFQIYQVTLSLSLAITLSCYNDNASLEKKKVICKQIKKANHADDGVCVSAAFFRSLSLKL